MILIDTNVFVGACMGVGASAKVVELCLRGQLQPVMGASLLAEYEDVVRREALFADCRLDVAQREELLDIILGDRTCAMKAITTLWSWLWRRLSRMW